MEVRHTIAILPDNLSLKLEFTNLPFYNCILSCQAFDSKWGWSWLCCEGDQYLVSMVKKSFTFEKQHGLYHNKVTLSLLFKGLATKYTTVKWTILINHQVFFCVVFYGLFHGLCYLPVLLSLIGPSPYDSSEINTEESPSSLKPDDNTDCKGAYFNPSLETSTGDLLNVGAHQQKSSLVVIEGKCIRYLRSVHYCKFSKSLMTLCNTRRFSYWPPDKSILDYFHYLWRSKHLYRYLNLYWTKNQRLLEINLW